MDYLVETIEAYRVGWLAGRRQKESFPAVLGYYRRSGDAWRKTWRRAGLIATGPNSTTSTCCGFVGQQVAQRAAKHLDMLGCCRFLVGLIFDIELPKNLLWIKSFHSIKQSKHIYIGPCVANESEMQRICRRLSICCGFVAQLVVQHDVQQVDANGVWEHRCSDIK